MKLPPPAPRATTIAPPNAPPDRPPGPLIAPGRYAHIYAVPQPTGSSGS